MGWLKFIETHKSPRTLILYRMVIWRFMDSLPHKIKLCAIRQEHIERHLALLFGSNRSKNCYLFALRSFFSFVEERFNIPSPASKIKALPAALARQRVLTVAEYQRILEACDECERATIQLLANTGLRSNHEFGQALHPANITDNMLHLVVKGGKQGAYPLNQTAKNAIAILLSHLKFSKNISKRNHLFYLCRRLSKKAHIEPPFSPHSLRYYYADSLRKAGVPIYLISRCLAHGSIRQTETYLHCREDEVRGASDILDKPTDNG